MRISRFLWSHGLKPVDVVLAAAALGLTLTITGCSADVSRFDFPSFGLNGDTGQTGALPRSDNRPLVQPNSYEQSQTPKIAQDSFSAQPTKTSREVRVTALDPSPNDAVPPPTYSRYEEPRAPVTSPQLRYPSEATSVGNKTSTRATNKAAMITVQRGDTLYGLARQHGVPVSELMAYNNLTSATIRPGQTLSLPGAGVGIAARAPAQPRAEPTQSRHFAQTDWNGSYTVVTGDSLYRIARKFGVRSSEIQTANRIEDPRRLRPGMVLKVPGNSTQNAARTTASRRVAAVSTRSAARKRVLKDETRSLSSPTTTPRVIQSTTKPTVVINAPAKKQAAIDPKTPPVSKSVSPSEGTSAKLKWPVYGKVIDGFGRRRDGTHNDGVNLAVAEGTPVNAAEAGVVAYAGSELQGYGNLILLRHDNGWVTAYAHNASILVKRGDKVRRGQTIAKAGKTGQVDRPQVHFELRKGSKPVDPLPYLEARRGRS